MDIESCVPPGFRFHPTEEELVGYYLKKKINSLKIDLDVIVDIDLYNIEPWEIQDRCIMGHEEQNEWYFFSHKDKKYPTGTRTNRATAAGFWKATGRDKAVLSKNRNIIGMRKTLVFYKGRAPNGRRSDWIMHEYRLQTSQNAPPQEEGWVVCRAFKKPSPNQRQGFEPWNHVCYNVRPGHDNHVVPRYLSNIVSPSMHAADDQVNQDSGFPRQIFGSFGRDMGSNLINDQAVGVGLPELDSPPSLSTSCLMVSESYGHINVGMFDEIIIKRDSTTEGCSHNQISNSTGSQYVDWKKLDELLAVAAQPGEGDAAATTSFSPSNLELYEIDAHNHAGPSPRTLS